MLGRSETPMTPVLLLFLLLIAVAAFLTVRFVVASATSPSGEEPPVQTLDLTRYAVMQNLLHSREVDFLRESGVSAGTIRNFRCQRRRIFRVYLRNLERDTTRLFRYAEHIVREASAESPELAERLTRARLRFRMAFWTLRWRLLLHLMGADAVDVSAALGSASDLLAALRTTGSAQRSLAAMA